MNLGDLTNKMLKVFKTERQPLVEIDLIPIDTGIKPLEITPAVTDIKSGALDDLIASVQVGHVVEEEKPSGAILVAAKAPQGPPAELKYKIFLDNGQEFVFDAKIFRTPTEMATGMLREPKPLNPNTLFIFPNVVVHGGAVVSVAGVGEPLAVYFVTEDFMTADGDGRRWVIEGDVVITIPSGTRHVVETSINAPRLANLKFLRNILETIQ